MAPPEMQSIYAEMDAQGTAKRVMDGESIPEEARLAIQGALDLAEEPTSFAAAVDQAAMRSILQQPIGALPQPTPGLDPENQLFEAIALLWLGWLKGSPQTPEMYAALRREASQVEDGSPGAIHRKTLILWINAMEDLLRGNRVTSLYLWRRALDLGSSFGTESHPTLFWAHTATFFPTTGRAFIAGQGCWDRSLQVDPRG